MLENFKNRKRIGSFYLTYYSFDETLKILEMLKVVPLIVEYDFAMDAFHYTALCESFHEIAPGYVPMEYNVELESIAETDKDGNILGSQLNKAYFKI